MNHGKKTELMLIMKQTSIGRIVIQKKKINGIKIIDNGSVVFIDVGTTSKKEFKKIVLKYIDKFAL
jgi:hypothetical protein